MSDVIEKDPLAGLLYGTDEEPNVSVNGVLFHHQPLGRDFDRGDIEAWDPVGTLGSGDDFVSALQQLPVLNSHSLDHVRFHTGFIRKSPRKSESVIFPGTWFRNQDGHLFVRNLYNGLCAGIVLVSHLTGFELVATLKFQEA